MNNHHIYKNVVNLINVAFKIFNILYAFVKEGVFLVAIGLFHFISMQGVWTNLSRGYIREEFPDFQGVEWKSSDFSEGLW